MDFSSFFNYPTEEANHVSSQDLVFLANRSQRDWAKMLQQTETYRFSKGDYVIRKGDTSRAFYIAVFGRFEELIPAKSGERARRVTVIEQGSVMGVQPFLDGLGHLTDVRALEDGQVAHLSIDRFEVLAAHEPELARAILFDLGRIVSLRLRQKTDE